ncbi:MAG: hypothetical protein HOV80_25230 [Polyangiaceae bacterium]|nr:hypothetical protein [Polyangiaceae bacterium]
MWSRREAPLLVPALAVVVFGCSEVTVVPEPVDLEEQSCHEACDVQPTFDCITACGSVDVALPTCVAGAWECPPVGGRFPSSLCDVTHAPGECGGAEGIGCSEGFVCDYGEAGDGTCGRSGQMGACIERPPSCYGLVVPEVPYCGCGGGRGYLEGCPNTRPFPPGTYATCDGVDDQQSRCGPWLECSGFQQCVRRPSGPAGAFEYACEAAEQLDPSNPVRPSCDSLRSHECGSDCTKIGDMVLLTCACAS